MRLGYATGSAPASQAAAKLTVSPFWLAVAGAAPPIQHRPGTVVDHVQRYTRFMQDGMPPPTVSFLERRHHDSSRSR